jgi:mono/diheme cytochrome c family protein
MRRHRHALVALLGAGLLAACRPPADAREARDFERMRQQQRYDPYESSRYFANGAVMQPPPAHTIARDPGLASHGQTATAFFLTGNDSGAATIPIVLDASTRAAGARQFAISCAPCHGAGGFGGGPVAPNLVEKRPPSLRSGAAAALPAGTLFSVITNGFGRMPPYGWQLTPTQRWQVVAYVRSLAREPLTTATRDDSARAAYLHEVDSLHAAGAPLSVIVRRAGQR